MPSIFSLSFNLRNLISYQRGTYMFGPRFEAEYLISLSEISFGTPASSSKIK
jgi:hypothetical protein